MKNKYYYYTRLAFSSMPWTFGGRITWQPSTAKQRDRATVLRNVSEACWQISASSGHLPCSVENVCQIGIRYSRTRRKARSHSVQLHIFNPSVIFGAVLLLHLSRLRFGLKFGIRKAGHELQVPDCGLGQTQNLRQCKRVGLMHCARELQ